MLLASCSSEKKIFDIEDYGMYRAEYEYEAMELSVFVSRLSYRNDSIHIKLFVVESSAMEPVHNLYVTRHNGAVIDSVDFTGCLGLIELNSEWSLGDTLKIHSVGFNSRSYSF